MSGKNEKAKRERRYLCAKLNGMQLSPQMNSADIEQLQNRIKELDDLIGDTEHTARD